MMIQLNSSSDLVSGADTGRPEPGKISYIIPPSINFPDLSQMQKSVGDVNDSLIDYANDCSHSNNNCLTSSTCISCSVINTTLHNQNELLFESNVGSTHSASSLPDFCSSVIPSFLQSAEHPFVCIFHFLWKICALIAYEMGYILFGRIIYGETDFVFSFVSTTIFLSLDFWTVKNVTGRILAGMRWWNNIKEDGTTEWIFECTQDERFINATDRNVFWIVIYIWPIVWSILAILEFLKLEISWLLLCVIGLVSAYTNLVGYWKCSKDQKRLTEWASGTAYNVLLNKWWKN